MGNPPQTGEKVATVTALRSHELAPNIRHAIERLRALQGSLSDESGRMAKIFPMLSVVLESLFGTQTTIEDALLELGLALDTIDQEPKHLGSGVNFRQRVEELEQLLHVANERCKVAEAGKQRDEGQLKDTRTKLSELEAALRGARLNLETEIKRRQAAEHATREQAKASFEKLESLLEGYRAVLTTSELSSIQSTTSSSPVPNLDVTQIKQQFEVFSAHLAQISEKIADASTRTSRIRGLMRVWDEQGAKTRQQERREATIELQALDAYQTRLQAMRLEVDKRVQKLRMILHVSAILTEDPINILLGKIPDPLPDEPADRSELFLVAQNQQRRTTIDRLAEVQKVSPSQILIISLLELLPRPAGDKRANLGHLLKSAQEAGILSALNWVLEEIDLSEREFWQGTEPQWQKAKDWLSLQQHVSDNPVLARTMRAIPWTPRQIFLPDEQATFTSRWSK